MTASLKRACVRVAENAGWLTFVDGSVVDAYLVSEAQVERLSEEATVGLPQEALEKFRDRLSHDLHEGPLQSMISFEMRLEVIRRLIHCNADAAAEELLALQQFSRKLAAEMRTFIHRVELPEMAPASSVATRREPINFDKEDPVDTELRPQLEEQSVSQRGLSKNPRRDQ